MTDSDYNLIKPVESLQNVGDITATKRREDRKKRQNSREQTESAGRHANDEPNQSTEENNAIGEITHKDGDEHSIDYCA